MLRRVLPLLAALCAVLPAAAAEPAREIRYRDDRVTLRLDRVPVTEVVAELAKQSGATVRGEVREARDVTLELTDTPVKEALQRLLGAQSFTLVYGEKGDLKEIELKGGPEDDPRRRAAAAGAKEGDRASWDAMYRLFDRREQLHLDGSLKQAVGKDEAGWDYVANTAIGSDDPRVRREAVRAALRALEGDPELRAAVLAQAKSMSDADFAAFARATCYHRAEDLVRNIARETRMDEFRERARGVLRELEKRPFEGPEPREGGGSASEG